MTEDELKSEKIVRGSFLKNSNNAFRGKEILNVRRITNDASSKNTTKEFKSNTLAFFVSRYKLSGFI